MKKVLFAFAVFTLSFSSCNKDNTGECRNYKIEICAEYSFENDVAPILGRWCCTCHGPNNDSGIELCGTDTYNEVKENACRIINAINHIDAATAMPRGQGSIASSAFRLTDEEIETITCWIQQGMKNN